MIGPDELVVRFPGYNQPRRVRGWLIGAILVRATFPDERTADVHGNVTSAANRWAVDHWLLPGVRYCDVASLSVALLLADEISRFAAGDLERVRFGPGPELVRAVGDVLAEWIEYVIAVDRTFGINAQLLDYRRWCAETGRPTPSARACVRDAGDVFDREARHESGV